jgi:hypothetical protein
MTSSLPGAWSLIVDSWNAFLKHWSTTVQYSAWMILVVAHQQIAFFFPEESGMWWIALLIGSIASIALAVWASIRLYQVVLAIDGGRAVDVKTTATAATLILPFLLVGLLEGLAVFGALLLLVIPGIYVGVRLAFSKFAVLEQGLRGRAALVASWNMTKDKFWAIFGRQLAGGVVFGLGFIVAILVLMMILSLFIGGEAMKDLNDASGPSSFLFGLGNGILQAAIIPLFVMFQVKLYRAVKKGA